MQNWRESVCRLRLDGSADVRVTAGGYMSTVFWSGPVTAEEAPFGTVVHRHLLAQLHDHLAGAPIQPGKTLLAQLESTLCSTIIAMRTHTK